MDKHIISVEVEVSDWDLTQILNCAICEHCSSWCDGVDYDNELYRNAKEKTQSIRIGCVLVQLLKDGGSINWRDVESDTVFEMRMDNLLNGISRYLSEVGKRAVNNWCYEDTDMIMQYALFGKLMHNE